jgi:hypothetical protein
VRHFFERERLRLVNCHCTLVPDFGDFEVRGAQALTTTKMRGRVRWAVFLMCCTINRRHALAATTVDTWDSGVTSFGDGDVDDEGMARPRRLAACPTI